MKIVRSGNTGTGSTFTFTEQGTAPQQLGNGVGRTTHVHLQYQDSFDYFGGKKSIGAWVGEDVFTGGGTSVLGKDVTLTETAPGEYEADFDVDTFSGPNGMEKLTGLDLAFHDDANRWDSNLGANYHVDGAPADDAQPAHTPLTMAYSDVGTNTTVTLDSYVAADGKTHVLIPRRSSAGAPFDVPADAIDLWDGGIWVHGEVRNGGLTIIGEGKDAIGDDVEYRMSGYLDPKPVQPAPSPDQLTPVPFVSGFLNVSVPWGVQLYSYRDGDGQQHLRFGNQGPQGLRNADMTVQPDGTVDWTDPVDPQNPLHVHGTYHDGAFRLDVQGQSADQMFSLENP